MGLTPEARKIGRRNFLKAVGGTSALAALGGAVVGTQNLAHARRVAAAADVFEQQRVIEIPELWPVQAQFAANAHADQATADGVAGNGVLGEVQREGERRNDLG